MSDDNKQKSPGTSDRGQLTASTTPYLPPVPKQPEYVPPMRPNPVMGPAIVDEAYLRSKLVYRELASNVEVTQADRDAQVAEAARRGGGK